MNNELSQPHDRFFKDIFSRKEVVIDFIQNYLPSSLQAKFDLSTLEIIKDSFVDAELRAHYSDMLYLLKLRAGQLAYIYILFEHKSYPEPLMAFQLLRYMLRIWESGLHQQRWLNPILPIVFYHGESKWHVGLNFKDLFQLPAELEPYLPDYRYWLCDLSQYSDEELQGQALLQVSLLLFKNIFSAELPDRLPGIFQLVKEILQRKSGLDCVESIFHYLASAGKNITNENLNKAVEKAIPQGGKIMSTLAEKWFNEGVQEGVKQGMQQGIQQGMQQGIQQGIQQGMQQGLLDYIELGLELKFGIEGLREFPRIRKITDIDVLHAIRNGIKTATSLEELRKIYQ